MLLVEAKSPVPVAPGARLCAFCDRKMSKHNKGKYCFAHSPEDIEAFETGARKVPRISMKVTSDGVLQAVLSRYHCKLEDLSVDMRGHPKDSPAIVAKRMLIFLWRRDAELLMDDIKKRLNGHAFVHQTVENVERMYATSSTVRHALAEIRRLYPDAA